MCWYFLPLGVFKIFPFCILVYLWLCFCVYRWFFMHAFLCVYAYIYMYFSAYLCNCVCLLNHICVFEQAILYLCHIEYFVFLFEVLLLNCEFRMRVHVCFDRCKLGCMSLFNSYCVNVSIILCLYGNLYGWVLVDSCLFMKER